MKCIVIVYEAESLYDRELQAASRGTNAVPVKQGRWCERSRPTVRLVEGVGRTCHL